MTDIYQIERKFQTPQFGEVTISYKKDSIQSIDFVVGKYRYVGRFSGYGQHSLNVTSLFAVQRVLHPDGSRWKTLWVDSETEDTTILRLKHWIKSPEGVAFFRQVQQLAANDHINILEAELREARANYAPILNNQNGG